MTYDIGGTTLPNNPVDVQYEAGLNLTEIGLPEDSPLLITIGDKADRMIWKINLRERGKTLAQLMTDYLVPLLALKRTVATLTVTNRSMYSGDWLFHDMTTKERGGRTTSYEVKFTFLKGSSYIVM
jgi:hypothetical protein